MTAPGLDVCACGCGAKPVDGVFWAFETCFRRWIAQQRREPPAPVRAFCGSTYTDQPPPSALDQLADAREEFAKFAETVKDELRPPLERTVGWLGRLLDRLGKGNQQ